VKEVWVMEDCREGGYNGSESNDGIVPDGHH